MADTKYIVRIFKYIVAIEQIGMTKETEPCLRRENEMVLSRKIGTVAQFQAVCKYETAKFHPGLISVECSWVSLRSQVYFCSSISYQHDR